MNRVALDVGAGMAIVRRDFKLALSYRLRFASQLLSGFFSLTLFYYLSRLVQVEVFESPDAYYAFAVIGLVILQVLNSTLATPPAAMRQELVAGTFERMVLSPFGPVGGAVSMLLFPFVYSLILAMAMLGFASLAFGLEVSWATVPLVIPVAVLGALSFAPFGIMLLAMVLVVKQVAAGTTWIIAGISLIAGLYFPVTLLPDWIEWMSDVQPFTPAVELMRNLLVDTPLTDSVWLNLGRMAGFAAVLMPASIWVLNKAVRASRRRGTIIEY
ncbi:MAG: ABC transporter permease [Thermoleophilaceae bacterium]